MTAMGHGAAIDAIALEIMWAKLRSAVDEAEAALLSTAFSSVAAESYDFACLLFDGDGRPLVASSAGIPGFIATMPRTIQAFIEKYPPDTLRPGDVLITNNPWLGGGHLNDFVLATPVFRSGRLVAFTASMAHATDIGGSLNWLGTREMYEEGLYIPPLKLVVAGTRNAAIDEIIRANSRVPSEVNGDLEAQLTANSVMARQILEFLSEYGMDDLSPLAHAIHGVSERAMRDALAKLPSGTYSHVHTIDGLAHPLELHVAVTIAGESIEVNYTGTSPQVEQGAINVVYNYTQGATAAFLKALLLPDLPVAEGFFRPLRVVAPPGTVLSATFPAATMSRFNVGCYIEAALACCLADVVPDAVLAPTGIQFVSKFYGTGRDGEPFGLLSIIAGGMGALAHKDGCSVTMFPSSASNCPIEILETRVPILVREKRLRADSGGAGRRRGGLGQRIVYAVAPGFGQPITVSFNARMFEYPAQGLLGGQPGQPLAMYLDERRLFRDAPEMRDGLLIMRPDSTLVVETAGGGGFGDPNQRERALIDLDLRDGLVASGAAPGANRSARADGDER